jgi:hypothetical protein
MAQQVSWDPSKVQEFSGDVQEQMEQKARETGSVPVQHLAEGLRAQHEMMVDKELLERFDRIGKRLDEARRQSPLEFERTRQQIQALRPLLRLSLRSVNFRNMMLAFLRIMKHVWEDNETIDVEKMMMEGEHRGLDSVKEEARKQGQEAWDSARGKRQLLRDEDWEKLNEKLDEIFVELRQHPDYQNAIHQLFELPSVLRMEARQNRPEMATERLKEESKELIAQFSGKEILDLLFDRIEELSIRFEENIDVQNWWKEFRTNLENTARGYSGKGDLERLRALLEQGVDIFDDFRPRVNKIIDTISEIFENMSNDRYVKELQERLSIIADDLYWVDNEGRKRFDTAVAQELTVAIAGILREQFQHMTLPDIMGEDKNVRYGLTNLNITASLPDKMLFHLESDAVLDTSREVSTPFQSELNLIVSIRGVELCSKSVGFMYDSNMYSETGLMDVTVPSSNLEIFFIYSPSKPRREVGFVKEVAHPITNQYQFLRVNTHFSVSDVKIKFDKSTLSHKIISPMLSAVYKPYLIYKFESGIQEALNQGLREVGKRISGIIEQAPYSLSLSGWGETGGKIVE